MLREVAGEVLVCAKPAALHALAPDADPFTEVRDRAGPESDVDLRVQIEDPLLLRLGVTAADRDDEIGVLALSGAGIAEVGGELRVGLLANRARVEDDDVRLLLRGRLAEAERLEHALDALGVVAVHLAAERREVIAAHIRSVGRACGLSRHGPYRARYISVMTPDHHELVGDLTEAVRSREDAEERTRAEELAELKAEHEELAELKAEHEQLSIRRLRLHERIDLLQGLDVIKRDAAAMLERYRVSEADVSRRRASIYRRIRELESDRRELSERN